MVFSALASVKNLRREETVNLMNLCRPRVSRKVVNIFLKHTLWDTRQCDSHPSIQAHFDGVN